ncbi:MAG TPA: hypothetical protein VLR54_01385 [Methanobacteriaceae archaeon]|nr:hypothetical protein [Methanobacteriaceae archaeon]
MRIVATPMCEEILIMAGITDYLVNKHPDMEEADFAVVLSETETQMPSLKIKLNTFPQIKESILKIAEIYNSAINSQLNSNYPLNDLDYPLTDLDLNLSLTLSKISPWANSKQKKILRKNNRKIKVKVYSLFLKDIIEDMGYLVVGENPDFVVFPDYLEEKITKTTDIQINSKDKSKIDESDKYNDVKYLKVPSHGDVPINPLERAAMRYKLLEGELCMKP